LAEKQFTNALPVDMFDKVFSGIKKENRKLKVKIERVDKKANILKQELRKFQNKDVFYTCTIITYKHIDAEEVPDARRRKKNIVHFQGRSYEKSSAPRHVNVVDETIVEFKGTSTYRQLKVGNTGVDEDDFKVNPRFEHLVEILEHDKDFADYYKQRQIYIDMLVVLKNTKEIGFNLKKVKAEKREALELYNTFDNNAIANKYIHYDVNTEAKQFKAIFTKVKSLDYVIENGPANSCFLNLIVDTFKPSFDKAFKNGRIKETLTYNYLLRIIQYYNNNATQHIGLTINQSVKFFEMFKLSLVCMDPYGKIFFEYRPPKQNKNIFPEVLYMLVQNNHCYKLNDGIKSLSQKYTFDADTEKQIKNLTVGDKTKIHDDPEEPDDFYMVDSLDEITNILTNTVNMQPKNMNLLELAQNLKKIKFIYNHDNLDDLLVEMVMKNNYTPNITHGKNILSIRFTVGTLSCTIISNDLSTGDTEMHCITDVKSYAKYLDINQQFYDSTMNSRHLSNFHPSTINIIDSYPIGPIVCKFNENADGFYNAIDMNKAYTDNLMQMEFVPVYNIFDVWTQYDNHTIEDYTQYLVLCKDDSTESKIMFDRRYNRVYGMVLKQIQNVKYKVLYHWRPSKLVPFNGKQIVDTLYDHDIENSMKKFIVNNNLGMAEKKYNKAIMSKVFKDLNEAIYYQCQYNGSIYSVGDGQNQLYILDVKAQQRLRDGFTPIKDFIYSYQRLKLFNLYQSISKAGIKVYGIKTDSMLVNIDKNEAIKRGFKFDAKIGGLKFELAKSLNGDILKRKINELVDIPSFRSNIIEVSDEFDNNELCGLILSNKKTAVFGEYPGVGKTTAIKQLEGKKLFVTPFNKLCQDLKMNGIDTVTLHSLIGLNVDQQQLGHNKCATDEKYDIICFDEILLYDATLLQHIFYYMQSHPKVLFYCTGDADQLPPINNQNLVTISEAKKYQNKCISILFPNRITLNVSKRLTNEEDRQKLIQLKKDIFDTSKDVITTFKELGFKCIYKMSDLKTTRNITYFNYYRKMINSYVEDNLIIKPNKTFEFGSITVWKGLELLSNSYLKIDKSTKIYCNYTYNFDSFNETGDKFTIIEPVDNKKITLDFTEENIARFSAPYANTCYSIQGMSIPEPITIFNTNTAYVSREFVWTAVTRSTDFNNVTIFVHGKKEVDRLYDSRIKQYLKFKVQSYMTQDKNAKRVINKDNFVTAEWILDRLKHNKACPCCKAPFELIVANGNVNSNISCDRIDNKISHVKSNLQLMCTLCNIRKK
jgi:hypothetical protein